MKTPQEIYKWLDTVICHSDEEEYVKSAKMYIGSFEQINWERDLAIAQLHELGYQLGEKIRENDRREN